MYTKVLAFLVLATLARGNDVIVGLKTDGRKFFDENRQANPALWRQMDNVTIKAPENEVIRRVVITDLRPEKDGDVKIVEGGEGQKNVTIELKSPTVLRGYEFHIEVYSTPEENVPFENDQKSTTEIVKDDSMITTDPTTNLDITSKIPDLSTGKIVPAVLSNDEIKESERQGRNANNEDNTTIEGTTDITTSTFKSDFSTIPATQPTERATKNHNENNSDISNKFEQDPTISPIPLIKNFNINPAIPAISGKDIENDKFKEINNEENRHVRDTEKEKSGKLTEVKDTTNSTQIRFESSTENNKETTTTEIRDAIPIEETSEDAGKGNIMNAPKSHTFDNHKYTSVISSKVEHLDSPIDVKNSGNLRNVRGAIEEQKLDESTTTEFNDRSSTLSSDDCVTTEAANVQNPINIDKDNNEDKTVPIPTYLNSRQWNQRFNNPTIQTGDNQSSPNRKIYPVGLANDQSTVAPETADAERLGNDYKPSPDHMENRNPKISAIASQRDRNMSPVVSTR